MEHLNGLLLHFSNYFNDLDFTKFVWIQNPFIDKEDDGFELTSIEKKQLIELSCDTSLKQRFQNVSLVQFWLNLNSKYNNLSNKALKVLLLFATSYLCLTGFSALAAMKLKYRAQLVVEKELRVAISSIMPRLTAFAPIGKHIHLIGRQKYNVVILFLFHSLYLNFFVLILFYKMVEGVI